MYRIYFRPARTNLILQISREKKELVKWMEDYDFHTMHLSEILNQEYLDYFGELELDIHELYIEISKTIRELNLYDQSLEEGQVVSSRLVQAKLNDEFALHHAYLCQRRKSFETDSQAVFSPADLNSQELGEMRQLFRDILLVLHPDLPASYSDEWLFFYLDALLSYEKGQVKELTFIKHMLVEKFEKSDDLTKLSNLELYLHYQELKQTTEYFKQVLKALQSSFPFNQVDLLSDPAKIEVRYHQLNQIKLDFEMTQAVYSQEKKNLLMELASYNLLTW